MKKTYLSRAQTRRWSTHHGAVGDPYGGPAYGEKREPATMAMIMTVAQVAGTVMTVVGAMNQGTQQQATYVQAAQASTFNSQVAEQNATVATSQGEADAVQQRRVNELRMGTIRASYGASGLTMEGSPIDVLSSSAAQAELDVQNIKYNAALKAQGYTNNATLDNMRAEGASAAAGSASSNGMFGAAAAGLSGGVKAFNMFKGTGTPIGGLSDTTIPMQPGGGY
ncbi:MAG: hypothetical protein V4641_13090 [Pseudomonadota bacterium]